MSERITPEQGAVLLRLARESINNRLGEGAATEPEKTEGFDRDGATFVTLKIHDKLRGCIGNIEPSGWNLWESVKRNAVNAAFYDSRFTPLTREELDQVHIDISILTEPAPLDYSDSNDLMAKLSPGKDGVILRHRGRGATFLPQVWEQLPTIELFLGHLCRKAGLADDCWLTEHPEIELYRVQSFGEKR